MNAQLFFIIGIIVIILIFIVYRKRYQYRYEYFNNLPADKLDLIHSYFLNIIQVNNIPGAIMSISSPNSGTYILKNGLANVQNNISLEINTLWPIRSITKSFTVYLILQLASEGLISLDDTINKYVGGLPNGNIITLRQLANMSAGNPDYTNNNFFSTFTNNTNRIFTLNELNNYIQGPALFMPGEKHVYVNANTNLLGAVIEKVTAKPYSQVLQEKILMPFGLNNTRYITDINNVNATIATGYESVDNVLTPQSNNLSIYGPAGSIVSSLPDQLIWARILGNGYDLTPNINRERFIANKLTAGPEYDVYGLGIGNINGWWGHTGEGLGITVLTMYNQQYNMAVTIFMNISGTKTNNIKEHLPTKLFKQITPLLLQ